MQAVVTLTNGSEFSEIAKITHPLMQQYADRLGADFVVIYNSGDFEELLYLMNKKIPASVGLPESCRWLFNAKLTVQGMLDSKYDRILLLDTDTLVLNTAPNIFEVVPATHVGLFEEASVRDESGRITGGMSVNSMQFFALRQNRILESWNLPKFVPDITRYYNTGVMVMTKNEPFLTPPLLYLTGLFQDQDLVNYQIQTTGVPVHHLDKRFNFMLSRETAQTAENAYIVHFAGKYFSSIERIEKIKAYYEHFKQKGLV